MPANVESMFYTGAEPWHGLGEKLEEAPTISRGYREVWSGLGSRNQRSRDQRRL